MILAALLAGGTSLAVAQNGPATGGEPPVAGGAGGNPAVPSAGYYGFYQGAPGYLATPGYAAPGYIAQPGYAVAPAMRRRSMYMYAPVQGGSTHIHKKHVLRTGTNGGY